MKMHIHLNNVVVVDPTPLFILAIWVNGCPFHSASSFPMHLHGTCPEIQDVRFVLIMVQLNKCNVCHSVVHMGHSVDGCLSVSILFRFERGMWI